MSVIEGYIMRRSNGRYVKTVIPTMSGQNCYKWTPDEIEAKVFIEKPKFKIDCTKLVSVKAKKYYTVELDFDGIPYVKPCYGMKKLSGFYSTRESAYEAAKAVFLEKKESMADIIRKLENWEKDNA